jgi:hypothetical protein
MQKVIAVETNEVPHRIWHEYTHRHPDSTLARFLPACKRFTTLADDVERIFLYPSQTWASHNTGAPYAQHQIHWYNDPKPAAHPLYWKAIAEDGRRVGYVNTLHSSPLAPGEERYCFAIPDCFGECSETYPARYQRFQALNLSVAQKSGRKASLVPVLRDALGALGNPSAMGLSPWSLKEIVATVTSVALGANVERLRNLQFPLIAEIFWREMRRTDPELAVLFTNHIAANMHRYWYALFPDDYPEKLYPSEWIRRYESEIMRAVDLFDCYLQRLVRFCESTDRILLICSSMGQAANPFLDKKKVSKNARLRVEQPMKLLEHLGGDTGGVAPESCMVPQYAFKYPTEDAAASASQLLAQNAGKLDGLSVKVDRVERVVTLTVDLLDQQGRVEYDGQPVKLKQLGGKLLIVDNHHSGKHWPEGSLLVFNDLTDSLFSSDRFSESFSYLEFAPELRRYFSAAAEERLQQTVHAEVRASA